MPSSAVRLRGPGTWSLLAVLALLGAACAAGSRATGSLSEERARVATLGVADAALLTQLPSRATFAWVNPSTIFTGIEPADGVHSLDGAFESLRYAASAVLLANDWDAAEPEQAQFHLAVAVVDRPMTRVRYQPDPRNEQIPRPVCHVDVKTKERICYQPASPRYPPIRSSYPSIDRKIGYVIRRTEDGATRWWIMNNLPTADAERFITRRTLELLLVEDR